METYLWMPYNGAVINTKIISMSYGQARELRAEDLPCAAAASDLNDISINLASSCPHLPSLMTASTNGDKIPKAVITVINKDGRGHVRNYLKFRMNNVLISKIDISNDQTAVVAFNFDAIELTYSPN